MAGLPTVPTAAHRTLSLAVTIPGVLPSPEAVGNIFAASPSAGVNGSMPTSKQKERKKATKSKKVVINTNFLNYLRPETFDKLFRKGHPEVYSSVKIKNHNDTVADQIECNFASIRAKRKDEARKSRSAAIELDLNSSPLDNSAVSFIKLSRYVIEDIL